MKREIKKMFGSKVVWQYTETLSQEIADHVIKFIEWKDNFTEFDIIKQKYKVIIETHIMEWMKFDKMYRFWVKNINKGE
jgi:hypothetical protein